MARTYNPLLSIDATGLIGGFIIFSHNYKRSIANVYKMPRDIKTFPRLVYRAEWGICVSRWRSAIESMKSYFTISGRSYSLAGNQYYMQVYFDLIKNNVTGHAVCNVSRTKQ